ncbi:MAG: hypothetical protein OSA81_01275 [Longimicrobiales bacterium]|nr:hypothetical protein [Longimicrobiales bacterium]
MSDCTVKVRLLFVDDGEYHHETVEIPAASADRYDRLIDCFLEDTDVMKKLFVDVGRLVSARIED